MFFTTVLYSMVNKCCAINCKSGYIGESTNLNITFHKFPINNEELLRVWLKRVARKDFKPTQYSRLCSLHFKPEDFIENSTDQLLRRKRRRQDPKLEKRRLKHDAIPSVFQDLPTYYTHKDTPCRSNLSLTSSRRENESAILEERCEKFVNDDKLANFDELITKFTNENKPEGFIMHHTQLGLNMLYLSEEQPPQILSVIFISKNLDITVYHEQKVVPQSVYSDIVSSKISLVSQVINVMAFAKNLDRSSCTSSSQLTFNITKLIEEYLEVSENTLEVHVLKFLLEQVQLLFTNKQRRRYSMNLLLLSYIIHATSAKAYERLIEEQVLMLPSVKTLRKITMNVDKTVGLDDSEYLHMRFSKLNAFDRNVVIMIDEIYLSKRIESSGGQLYGLTNGCQVATTALCFMVKALSSGYRDMVGIFPIKNIKADSLKCCYDKVMELIHKVGFNVVAISIDNASANRKFYKDCLCNGSWKNSIKNSYTGGTIFLVFDPTHIIKNIYNNFLTKRIFKLLSLPPFVPNSLTANFSDVQLVYDNECDKPLRIAHKLSDTVLKPKTIEKVNVKLALSVLHDSTVLGLKQFNCSETAATIELFIKFWSIVNVSDPTTGKHKRNIIQDPIRS